MLIILSKFVPGLISFTYHYKDYKEMVEQSNFDASQLSFAAGIKSNPWDSFNTREFGLGRGIVILFLRIVTQTDDFPGQRLAQGSLLVGLLKESEGTDAVRFKGSADRKRGP